ncbi:hypothetical protein C7M84_022483 [Penaeus vannamei]|uniref:Uncharacterized protein n=1 Tax=Penaeus vannamei TaxID=6689 RepID=A0A3R7MRV5_PENVA|nr:hypothetical protein C7M84_022483 [Penaeus vannamei]
MRHPTVTPSLQNPLPDPPSAPPYGNFQTLPHRSLCATFGKLPNTSRTPSLCASHLRKLPNTSPHPSLCATYGKLPNTSRTPSLLRHLRLCHKRCHSLPAPSLLRHPRKHFQKLPAPPPSCANYGNFRTLPRAPLHLCATVVGVFASLPDNPPSRAPTGKIPTFPTRSSAPTYGNFKPSAPLLLRHYGKHFQHSETPPSAHLTLTSKTLPEPCPSAHLTVNFQTFPTGSSAATYGKLPNTSPHPLPLRPLRKLPTTSEPPLFAHLPVNFQHFPQAAPSAPPTSHLTVNFPNTSRTPSLCATTGKLPNTSRTPPSRTLRTLPHHLPLAATLRVNFKHFRTAPPSCATYVKLPKSALRTPSLCATYRYNFRNFHAPHSLRHLR